MGFFMVHAVGQDWCLDGESEPVRREGQTKCPIGGLVDTMADWIVVPMDIIQPRKSGVGSCVTLPMRRLALPAYWNCRLACWSLIMNCRTRMVTAAATAVAVAHDPASGHHNQGRCPDPAQSVDGDARDRSAAKAALRAVPRAKLGREPASWLGDRWRESRNAGCGGTHQARCAAGTAA